MGIKQEELQELLTQTRQFLNLVNTFLDTRNESLKQRAVDDSLYINYATGQLVIRNAQREAEYIARSAERLGLSSVPSYIKPLKKWLIDKPYWALQAWRNGGLEASWQGQARDVAQSVRQILLSAQEWLALESYNIHMAAVGVPVPTHLKFDKQLEEVNQALAAIFSSSAYKNITDKLVPMSQRESWLSEEMRTGLLFLRLRVDWRLIQDYRAKLNERNKSTGKPELEAIDTVSMGQADLKKLLDMLKEKNHPRETSLTADLIDKNTELEQYLPVKGMENAFAQFKAIATAHAGQHTTAAELEEICSMKTMPRPNGFGRTSHD